jgi:hypothetical protein
MFVLGCQRQGGSPAVWAHPLDVHLCCSSLTGWPQLMLEVWDWIHHTTLGCVYH